MLTPDMLTYLQDTSPQCDFGVVGVDPGGQRARVVFPLFGASNVHHYAGSEFEAARRGGVGSIRVAKVRSVDMLIAQCLVWGGRTTFADDPVTGMAPRGSERMRVEPYTVPPAVEVRTAVLRLRGDGGWGANLQTGEPVQLTFPADALSLPVNEDMWLVVGDDAVDVERRNLNPRSLPKTRFAEDPGEECWWVLLPGNTEEDQGVFYPVHRLPMSTHLGHVKWLGAHGRGESPFVLSHDQAEQVRTGVASDMLFNAAAHRVAKWHGYARRLRDVEPGEYKERRDAVLMEYGVHLGGCPVSSYATSAESALFGRSTDVNHASASTVPAVTPMREVSLS